MTILSVVYASAPAGEVIIPTLEIIPPTGSPIRICAGFENHTVTLETAAVVTFTAAGLTVALPAKDTSGQQNLAFAIDNVTGHAQAAIDAAIENGGQTLIKYREYLSSDLSAPASSPLVLTMVGASFDGATVTVQASYFDLLNTAWPRERYTTAFAPGLKYL